MTQRGSLVVIGRSSGGRYGEICSDDLSNHDRTYFIDSALYVNEREIQFTHFYYILYC